ncbi:hypothetical protein D3C76_1084300 [compost metagenome]
MAVFATSIQAHRRLERLGRVRVGGEHEEFQFGRHHRGQAKGCITRDNGLELAARREPGAFTGQLVGIADRQGAGLLAPGQAMNLFRIGHQRQVAVVAAVETRRRITAHDALQQHAPRQLQPPAFEETLSGHHLAPRHAIQIRRDTFNLINARQSLRE